MASSGPMLEGRRAAKSGKRRDSNPYTGGTNGWHDWFAGFDAAKAAHALHNGEDNG